MFITNQSRYNAEIPEDWKKLCQYFKLLNWIIRITLSQRENNEKVDTE